MKRMLKNPLVNAACLILFTAFYASVFLATAQNHALAGRLESMSLSSAPPFWRVWTQFLSSGRHAWIAWALIGLTLLVVLLLVLRRRPYDEYHTEKLILCLAAATVLTLLCIGAFYLMILLDPRGIVEKFTLFIVIHWATVALADLAYVIACRWG